jgi:hypothetical protein
MTRSPTVVEVADGVRALKVERVSPLPSNLPALLGEIVVVRTHVVRVTGTRLACRDDHEYAPWIDGYYRGMDLRLSQCIGCGVVEVRDVSYHMLPGVRSGRSGPRRLSDVLGWYSGRRANARTYL